MKKIRFSRSLAVVVLLGVATGVFLSLAQYGPDRLGEGFESRTLVMPDDYSGRVVTTLVRSL